MPNFDNTQKSPQGAGSVYNDTHALGGSYTASSDSYSASSDSYTPSSDTHALTGSYTASTHSYTPSSDTHALGGAYTASSHSYSASSDTHALGGSLSTTNQASGKDTHTTLVSVKGQSLNGSSDNQLCTVAITPAANSQKVIVVAFCVTDDSAGATTFKLKRGVGGTLLSSSVADANGKAIIVYEDTGASGATTYELSYNPAGFTQKAIGGLHAQDVVDSHALTGAYTASSDSYVASSDTHALTGAYTAETHSYVASSDTHALGGSYTASTHSYVASTHSYSASSDTHALTGSQGSCAYP